MLTWKTSPATRWSVASPSAMSGGSCGSGALAAGFGSFAGPLVPANLYAGTVVSAIVGGVGSVLGGGKFENGAVTASFGYLFNASLNETRAFHDAQVQGLANYLRGAGLQVETEVTFRMADDSDEARADILAKGKTGM